MKTIKVFAQLVDPIGTDSDGEPLTVESSQEELNIARTRAHLHGLNTQPHYKKWILKNLSKRQRRKHMKAARLLASLLHKRSLNTR